MNSEDSILTADELDRLLEADRTEHPSDWWLFDDEETIRTGPILALGMDAIKPDPIEPLFKAIYQSSSTPELMAVVNRSLGVISTFPAEEIPGKVTAVLGCISMASQLGYPELEDHYYRTAVTAASSANLSPSQIETILASTITIDTYPQVANAIIEGSPEFQKSQLAEIYQKIMINLASSPDATFEEREELLTAAAITRKNLSKAINHIVQFTKGFAWIREDMLRIIARNLRTPETANTR